MTRSPFDALAHDYDAARPHYPDDLYDAVARLSGVDWLGAVVADVGAGTGIASRAMLARGAHVVAFDIGAGVLGVLRPGGALAVCWNEVDAVGEPWWDAQQERLEAGSPGYVRSYRERPYGDELEATGRFESVVRWDGRWQRDIDLDTYERWLRSKSYVAALGDGLDEFLAAERESLLQAFPDGVVREPFAVRLWVARRGDR